MSAYRMLSHILLSHLYPRTCSPWLIMQPLASTAPEYSNRQNGLHVCCIAAAKNIFATTHSLCISIVPFCLCMLAVCCAAHTPCGTLQEKHRWQMAAAEAGLKVVHDSWVVHFWCGQPAAICCHAFCCPDGPVRPRLSAVCDDSCRVQLPVGRQVHMGGFCEHCHHSWRCAACSVPLVPGLPVFCLLQGSKNMLLAISALFMLNICNSDTLSFCLDSCHFDYTLCSPKRLAAEITVYNT